MTGTRVSVIIPTYNRQHKIGAAIRSVLQQTFRDFELIVVDDASTDGTLDILDEFKDKRIRVVRHTRNSGSSQARNTGLNSSRSKYIAFLDSDDEWMEDKLFLQMEALEKFPDDIVANVCGYLLHDEFGIERKMIPPHPGSWHKLLIMGCGLGEGSTLVVNRQAFEQVGFLDVTFPRYADWEWLLRFTRQYPIITTPEILAVVHRDETPSAKKVEIAAGRFLEKHINGFYTFGS
jgi:glycosyltransferase involved in cell wall biosynthesis